MTGKIYSSLFISVFFHSLFFILLIFSVKNSSLELNNPTYVSLINETYNTKVSPQQTNEVKKEKIFQSEKPSINNEKNNKVSKADEGLLQERLSALRAKKKIAESRILQQTRISQKTESDLLQVTGSLTNVQTISQNYLGIISGLIRQNWHIPETVPKNLEAVVSIRILSNGHLIIEGFEKPSGNMLFDSSVIKAIKNSSPLPPPKGEVVVGLRFKP